MAGAKTFLVCHGAWSAGWAWRKMRPLLNTATTTLVTPTMTGVGERAHLGGPNVTLDTHIEDILAVVGMEDLSDIVLIGHSYGGLVATGVADRLKPRIAHLVYLDAFVGENGKSLYGMLGRAIPPPGADWRVPPRATPADTSAADLAWITPRRTPQPLGAFVTPLRVGGPPAMPVTYIRCTRLEPGDPMGASARVARDRGWRTVEIDASHNPHITAPDALAAILLDIAEGA